MRLSARYRTPLLGAVHTLLLTTGVIAAVGLGTTVPATADHNGAAATVHQIAAAGPPMGWASWNSFAAKIDYGVIKAQADAMVSSGMKAAGYSSVNIDEGWWQGSRDGAGNITVDDAAWPGGMKAIADYLHGKGLKAGIYTDAGRDGCGYYFPTGRPAAPGTGSEGHYEQDMLQFQSWGFDFVKVDWCGGDAEGLDPQTTYQAISDANHAAAVQTGHSMVLSICDWGRKNPWNWGAGMAPMWRTSTDIVYFGQTATLPQALTNFDQAQHPVSQHTGYVNDPDMLTVGMPGLAASQGRTELSMWAISGAPLLAGNNLTTMSSATAELLTNRDVIRIDQDPRGLQGVKVAEDATGLQVYSKVLAGSGRRAVLLLNRTSSAATVAVRWTDLGLTAAKASVRNVWTARDVGRPATGYGVSVPANDSVLLTITGTEAGSTGYEAEAAGNILAGSAAVASCRGCSGRAFVDKVGNGSANTLRFNGISAGATGLAVATIAYVNGDATARTATLAVNGQQPTVVAFPPTGSRTAPGTVSVLISLGKGSGNSLTFSNATAWAPNLDAITVSPLPGTDGAEVLGTQSGRCLDVNDNTIANGTQAQLWECAGGLNQTWVSTRGQLVVNGTKCLDAYNSGTTDGTAVVVWDCNGQRNQQWALNADGTITNVLSGLCLDANNNGTTNGTKIILWTCGAAVNQQWSLR